MAVERRIISSIRPEPLADYGRAGRVEPYPVEHEAEWYVVHVKPRHEGSVQRRLALATLTTFLPFIEVLRRRGGARTHCLEPLFPRYLFVRMASMYGDPASWNRVRWT
ncbi:MAG: transcription termination/antitermination protein NusG, partial [Acidimicrobiia bacterium]